MRPIPTDKYTPRTVTYYGMRRHDARRIKVYGVIDTDNLNPDLLEYGYEQVTNLLDDLQTEDMDDHGVAFMIVHATPSGTVFLTLCSWKNGNELDICTWSMKAGSGIWQDADDHGLILCTWDIAIIAYERDLWVRKVLRSGGHDVETYLENGLTSTF